MDDGKYYYCLDHNKVETAEGCKAADRLGPYDTPEEAQNALATLHARNEELDRQDEEEGDGWGPFRN